jgi:hypothetical protein
VGYEERIKCQKQWGRNCNLKNESIGLGPDKVFVESVFAQANHNPPIQVDGTLVSAFEDV